MATITIQRKQRFKVGIPLWIYINEQPVGILRGRAAAVRLPEGTYDVCVRLVLKVLRWDLHLGGSKRLTVQADEQAVLTITDKERWWNLLFDIDLVLWLAEFFFQLPSPWGTIYEILSNGFFALWIFRLIWIHDRYYQLNLCSKFNES